MRALSSLVLVLVCSWTSAYDYGQTYPANTQAADGADRRSDGLVTIDRNNQPGDNPDQPGPYEAPAYHEERMQYDERDLDPFAARNAGYNQYAATASPYADPSSQYGAPANSPYQDSAAPSPYQTPQDQADLAAQSEAATGPAAQTESTASQVAKENEPQETQADQAPQSYESQVAAPQTNEAASRDQQTSPYQTAADVAAQASPYQTPADVAQQTQAVQTTTEATQADQQNTAPAQSTAADAATNQAASLPAIQADQPATTYQAPAAAAPAPGAAEVPSADTAAYSQSPQLLNDEQTVNTIPTENKETPAPAQPEQDTQKEKDAETKTPEQPKLSFHLNRAGYSQMPMLDSNPGIRIMSPAMQQNIFNQIGAVPQEQNTQENEQTSATPQSTQENDQTSATPQNTAQADTTTTQETVGTVKEETSGVQQIQSDAKPAQKEQTKEASKGNILNYTIRVKPEHANTPEVQDIAFFPSDNAEGKPLLVLKQNVTRPIVENIEITLPKGHKGKPIIKVFRDGTPEAKALESGTAAKLQDQHQQTPPLQQQEVPQQQQQQAAPEKQQIEQQDQQQAPQQQQQVPQQQDQQQQVPQQQYQQQQIPQQQDQQQQIPQQQDQQQQIPQQQDQQQQIPQQQDQQQQGDKQQDEHTHKDEPKKYYDSDGNEIPPPPYDDYPGTMEDLKQSFEETEIPYHDNPACISYRQVDCGQVWTQRNCPHLCKIKMFKASTKPVVLGELPCFDLPACKTISTALCDPKFGHFWVRNNCRKMCGICKKSALLCYDRAKCKIFQISDCAKEFVKYTCPKKCASCAAGLALWDAKEVHGFPYKKSTIPHKSHKHHKGKTHKRHIHKKHHLRRARRDEENEDKCEDKPECPTFPSSICNHQWMKRNCPDMCGVCAEKSKQQQYAADHYVDVCASTDHTDCARYTNDRCTDSWLNDNCKHMCGACPQAAPAAAPQAPVTAQFTSQAIAASPPTQAFDSTQSAQFAAPGKRSTKEDDEVVDVQL